MIVEGHVEGDLQGSEQVILRESANVLGDIKAPRVTLEDGAYFRGSIEMTRDSERESRSPSASSGMPAATAAGAGGETGKGSDTEKGSDDEGGGSEATGPGASTQSAGTGG